MHAVIHVQHLWRCTQKQEHFTEHPTLQSLRPLQLRSKVNELIYQIHQPFLASLPGTFTKDSYFFSGSKVAKKYSYSKLYAILSPKNSLEMSNSQNVNTTSLNDERTIKVNLSILDAIPTNLYDTSGDESNNKRKRKIGR